MHTEEDWEVSEGYIAKIEEEMGIYKVYHKFCDILCFACVSNWENNKILIFLLEDAT